MDCMKAHTKMANAGGMCHNSFSGLCEHARKFAALHTVHGHTVAASTFCMRVVERERSPGLGGVPYCTNPWWVYVTLISAWPPRGTVGKLLNFLPKSIERG